MAHHFDTLRNNPDIITTDKSNWNFKTLKGVYNALPESYRRQHPIKSLNPRLLRNWILDNAKNFPAGCGGSVAQQPSQDDSVQQSFRPRDATQGMQQRGMGRGSGGNYRPGYGSGYGNRNMQPRYGIGQTNFAKSNLDTMFGSRIKQKQREDHQQQLYRQRQYQMEVRREQEQRRLEYKKRQDAAYMNNVQRLNQQRQAHMERKRQEFLREKNMKQQAVLRHQQENEQKLRLIKQQQHMLAQRKNEFLQQQRQQEMEAMRQQQQIMNEAKRMEQQLEAQKMNQMQTQQKVDQEFENLRIQQQELAFVKDSLAKQKLTRELQYSQQMELLKKKQEDMAKMKQKENEDISRRGYIEKVKQEQTNRLMEIRNQHRNVEMAMRKLKMSHREDMTTQEEMAYRHQMMMMQNQQSRMNSPPGSMANSPTTTHGPMMNSPTTMQRVGRHESLIPDAHIPGFPTRHESMINGDDALVGDPPVVARNESLIYDNHQSMGGLTHKKESIIQGNPIGVKKQSIISVNQVQGPHGPFQKKHSLVPGHQMIDSKKQSIIMDPQYMQGYDSQKKESIIAANGQMMDNGFDLQPAQQEVQGPAHVKQQSTKDKLLEWCQEVTRGFPGVNITNFTTSWRDGLAFAALTCAHKPSILDFDSLKGNQEENLTRAFQAGQSMDVTILLDAADVSYSPEELSITTQVSEYQKVLKDLPLIGSRENLSAGDGGGEGSEVRRESFGRSFDDVQPNRLESFDNVSPQSFNGSFDEQPNNVERSYTYDMESRTSFDEQPPSPNSNGSFDEQPSESPIGAKGNFSESPVHQNNFDEQPVGGGGGVNYFDEQPVGGGGGVNNFDEQPVGGGGGNNFDEQPVGGGRINSFDDQPVGGGGGGGNSFDDQPVGGGGGGNSFDDQPVGGGGGNNFAEQPIGGGGGGGFDEQAIGGGSEFNISEHAEPVKMSKCKTCGRSFKADRMKKHKKICKKISKKKRTKFKVDVVNAADMQGVEKKKMKKKKKERRATMEKRSRPVACSHEGR